MFGDSFLKSCLLTNGQLTHPDLPDLYLASRSKLHLWKTRELIMDNQSALSVSGKNELIETMFKSLNSYTSELQQELESLNGKLNDQIRVEQNHDKTQEQLQDELIKLRASIETSTVRRSILDRNLTERMTMSQSFHDQIVNKRDEQKKLLEQANLMKYNHHRAIAKITEQCANLAIAFRTNYHAYARADLDEIRTKTDLRMKTMTDEVNSVEALVEVDREKLKELNEKLQYEMQHLTCLKDSVDMIAKKLQIETDEIVELNHLEEELAHLQTSIQDLETWHRRTNYPSNNQ